MEKLSTSKIITMLPDAMQTDTAKTTSIVDKFSQFPRYPITDKNIFKKYDISYISDFSSSHLYSEITGVFPHETSSPKYDILYLDGVIQILMANEFHLASGGAKCQSPRYIDDFSLGGEEETFTYISSSYFLLYSFKLMLSVKLDVDDTSIEITLSSNDLSKNSLFLRQLELFELKKTHNEIGIIHDNGNGLSIKKIKIDPVLVDIGDNYGSSFLPVHASITKKLKEKKTGLFLLHSSPGNGKSFYIKYLSQILTERLFIFVPTSMIDSIVSPSLISVLLNNPNAVLILEDAEQAIMSREENPNGASLVSNILNISDGIMGSILSVSLILTFNTERANIDKALLRKGRLQAEWEFKELGLEESKKLAKKLGKDESKITTPTKLCDIYNLDEINFHQEKQEKKIGF